MQKCTLFLVKSQATPSMDGVEGESWVFHWPLSFSLYMFDQNKTNVTCFNMEKILTQSLLTSIFNHISLPSLVWTAFFFCFAFGSFNIDIQKQDLGPDKKNKDKCTWLCIYWRKKEAFPVLLVLQVLKCREFECKSSREICSHYPVAMIGRWTWWCKNVLLIDNHHISPSFISP